MVPVIFSVPAGGDHSGKVWLSGVRFVSEHDCLIDFAQPSMASLRQYFFFTSYGFIVRYYHSSVSRISELFDLRSLFKEDTHLQLLCLLISFVTL